MSLLLSLVMKLIKNNIFLFSATNIRSLKFLEDVIRSYHPDYDCSDDKLQNKLRKFHQNIENPKFIFQQTQTSDIRR